MPLQDQGYLVSITDLSSYVKKYSAPACQESGQFRHTVYSSPLTFGRTVMATNDIDWRKEDTKEKLGCVQYQKTLHYFRFSSFPETLKPVLAESIEHRFNMTTRFRLLRKSRP